MKKLLSLTLAVLLLMPLVSCGGKLPSNEPVWKRKQVEKELHINNRLICNDVIVSWENVTNTLYFKSNLAKWYTKNKRRLPPGSLRLFRKEVNLEIACDLIQKGGPVSNHWVEIPIK